MKHSNSPQHKPTTSPPNPEPSAAQLAAGAVSFVPAPDAVARKAYFTYVNQGSRPGHEVQHWLQAEAELIAERNRTRTHGFHNPT
jgi:hypothetical protein